MKIAHYITICLTLSGKHTQMCIRPYQRVCELKPQFKFNYCCILFIVVINELTAHVSVKKLTAGVQSLYCTVVCFIILPSKPISLLFL